ncbi:unnamed protein product [Urochloa humidicola]
MGYFDMACFRYGLLPFQGRGNRTPPRPQLCAPLQQHVDGLPDAATLIDVQGSVSVVIGFFSAPSNLRAILQLPPMHGWPSPLHGRSMDWLWTSPLLYSMANQKSPIFTPWIPSTPLFFTPWQIKRLSLLSLDEASSASIVVQPVESWPGSVHHPTLTVQTRAPPPSTSRIASRFTIIDFCSGNRKSISLLQSLS